MAQYIWMRPLTIKANEYEENHAALGQSIYGVGSTINGSSTSPFIKDSQVSLTVEFRNRLDGR